MYVRADAGHVSGADIIAGRATALEFNDICVRVAAKPIRKPLITPATDRKDEILIGSFLFSLQPVAHRTDLPKNLR